MNNLDEMLDFLETLDVNQQVSLWNSYMEEPYIRFLEEGVLDGLDMTLGELAYSIMQGSCNWDDLYFYFNSRQIMQTFTTADNNNYPIDIKQLAYELINYNYQIPDNFK